MVDAGVVPNAVAVGTAGSEVCPKLNPDWEAPNWNGTEVAVEVFGFSKLGMIELAEEIAVWNGLVVVA